MTLFPTWKNQCFLLKKKKVLHLFYIRMFRMWTHSSNHKTFFTQQLWCCLDSIWMYNVHLYIVCFQEKQPPTEFQYFVVTSLYFLVALLINQANAVRVYNRNVHTIVMHCKSTSTHWNMRISVARTWIIHYLPSVSTACPSHLLQWNGRSDRPIKTAWYMWLCWQQCYTPIIVPNLSIGWINLW